jgi:DNA methylase
MYLVPSWHTTNAGAVWTLPTVKVGEKTEQPTSKPVEVFALPMRQHSRPGEVCYEPFSGSGSQIIAGETTGRRVYAIEISPQYVDVAVRRWQTASGKPATLDGERPHVRRDRRRTAAEGRWRGSPNTLICTSDVVVSTDGSPDQDVANAQHRHSGATGSACIARSAPTDRRLQAAVIFVWTL